MAKTFLLAILSASPLTICLAQGRESPLTSARASQFVTVYTGGNSNAALSTRFEFTGDTLVVAGDAALPVSG